MAAAVSFHPKSTTLAEYQEVDGRLDAADEGRNPRRLQHSCFGPDGDLMVDDIWDSRESFDAFGKVLTPIPAEVGVGPGEPAVMPLHNLLQFESG